MKTRSERLHALIAKVAPKAADQHANDGTWPLRPALDPNDQPEAQAPYVIQTLDSGKRKIVLVSDDGDTLAGIGDTVDAALAHLEEKLA